MYYTTLAITLLFTSALAESIITSDSCNNMTMPMLTTRYHDQTCIIECDGETESGEPNLACFAFSDGVLQAYEKHGLYNKDMCFETTLQAMGADPRTDDPEMIVTSCPEFFLYMGWDRNVKRTLGNMRQEVQCKTNRSLQVMIEMLKK